MFSKKFWLDAGDAFLLAAVVVLAVDAESLIAAGSWEQFSVLATALGRAALVAGLRAIAPKFLRLKSDG